MLHSLRQALSGLGPDAVIYTVDLDLDPLIGPVLGIGSVPVVAFMRDGREVERWSAYRPTALVRGPLRRFFAQ
jgi:thioredoxin-like negative regulator of GroEL